MAVDMKGIDGPVQIVGGCLNCPHCAGELVLQKALGLGINPSVVLPILHCKGCKAFVGLQLLSEDDHTRISWVEVPAEVANVQERFDANAHETNPSLN